MRTFWTSLSGATERLTLSGAAAAAVAKSALAPNAKQIAIFFMMSSGRGMSKLQRPWLILAADNPSAPRGSLHNGCSGKEFRPTQLIFEYLGWLRRSPPNDEQYPSIGAV